MTKKYGYEFDPLKGSDVPKKEKPKALEEIAQFVKEQVLSYIGDGKSPVSGGNWKKSLTKEYKKIKGQESSVNFANLELSGDLLDALDVVVKSNGKLSLEVSGDQAGKAEGNNIGSYGRDPNPKNARRFIPLSGETLKKQIVDGIKDIIQDYEKD